MGLELPALLVLMLGIWGVIKGCVMFFMAFKGGGGAYAIIGIFAIFFGLILIVAYTVPGVGFVAVWFAALLRYRRLLPDLSRSPTAEGVRPLTPVRTRLFFDLNGGKVTRRSLAVNNRSCAYAPC